MGKFKIYFIIISIFCCLFAFDKATAEEVQTYNSVLDSLEDDITEYTSFSYGTIYSHMANTPRITSADVYHALRLEDEHSILYEISFNQGVYTFFGYRNNSYQSIFTTDGFTHTSMCNMSISSNSSIYLFTIFINKDSNKFFYVRHNFTAPWPTARNFYNYQTQIGGRVDMYYGGSTWAYMTYGESCAQNISLTNATSILACGDVYYYVAEGDNLIFPNNYVDPSVEDDRLSIYTGVSLKGPALFIDCNEIATDFELANNGFQSMSMQPHSYTLTLDCDGVSVPYVVDAQNSKWVDSYTSRTYITDFDIDSYNNVKVTSVSFSLQGINQRGTFTEDYDIITDVYLKQTTEDSGSSVITDPIYDNDNITDEEITTIINNLNMISSSHSNGTWQFLYDLPSLPSWATVYEFSLAYNTLDSVNYADRFYYYPYSEGDLHIDLESILNDSVYRLYDVILIDVYSGEWGADPIFSPPDYVLDRYLVFYTDKYYTRQNGYSISDIIKLIKNDVDNSILFYEYVKMRLDDFENKVLIKLNSSNTYLSSINVWAQVLNNGVNSLHTDLQSLLTSISNLQFPSFDDSDIITSIDNVITALGGISGGDSSYSLPSLSNELKTLFIPSFEWQDLNYEDYMESLGVLALPFEFTFDVLDIAENQYSSNLELHLDSLSIPIPDGSGGSVEFDVFQETDYTFSPTQLIDSTTWSMLQYLNLFLLVIVQAGSTFLLIFGKGENET